MEGIGDDMVVDKCIRVTFSLIIFKIFVTIFVPQTYAIIITIKMAIRRNYFFQKENISEDYAKFNT